MIPMIIREDTTFVDDTITVEQDKNDHLGPNCSYKDQIDLRFCIKCGVGNHSLEDFPIILENIMSKNNVNHLSRVPKNEVLNTKNLQIITRQGTKIR